MSKFKREAPISIYPPVILYNHRDIEKIWEGSNSLSLEESMANLYVHIPFCAQKCEFCYYTSFPANNSTVRNYINALKKEIEMLGQQSVVKQKIFQTIYFGGGTPTYLKKEQLIDLIHTIRDNFNIAADCEFCVEVRPGKEATFEKLKALFDEGVNRISMGAQSFNEEILALNGRNQKVQDFFSIYQILRDIGFNNINIDVMSGMIGDTDISWEETIDTVLSLHPENITVYKMCIYKSSELYKKLIRNQKEGTLVSEETELIRVKYFYQRMYDAGYTKSSNPYTFTSSKDYDHTYRLLRTSGSDLLGVGLSSNSFFNHVVYQNTHDMDDYIEKINCNQYPIKNGYYMSHEEIMKRALVFLLKTTRIDRKIFEKSYGKDPYIAYQAEFDKMKADGIVKIEEEEITLVGDSYLFTDDIVRTYLFSEKEKKMEKLLVLHKNVTLKV